MKQKCSDLSKVKANANNTINMGQMIGLVNDGKHCELYLVYLRGQTVSDISL